MKISGSDRPYTFWRWRPLPFLLVFLITFPGVIYLLQSKSSVTMTNSSQTSPGFFPESSLFGLNEPAQAGYERVASPQPLSFPEAHGPHLNYQTEWWYYTGNLFTAVGDRFGYQLTFFRRSLQPMLNMPSRSSIWGGNQVYMAHFAVTDQRNNQHIEDERLARGAAGLAGAEALPFEVWLDDWTVKEIARDTYQLTAANEQLAVELILIDKKGPILHGDMGYSQKGPDPGNASVYYSFTRLQTTGSVRVQPASISGHWK